MADVGHHRQEFLGEALVVMNKGFEEQGAPRPRIASAYTRLAQQRAHQAQAVKADLPKLEAEARAERPARADVGLGMTYTRFAQYDTGR